MQKLLFLTVLSLLLAACGGGGGGGSCDVANPCEVGKFCAYHDGGCGAVGSEGSCTDVPLSCPATVQPVCSCDKITFFNECFASAGGQSVQAPGECA